MWENIKTLILDRKNFGKILLIQLLLVFLLPFILYPLYESILSNIYNQNFPDIDSKFILKIIRTTIYLYIWVDQIWGIFSRTLLISTVYFLGIKLLEIKERILYRNLVLFVFGLQIVFIIGDYINILYNYFIRFYNIREIKLFESPLNLSYYFPLINKSSTVFRISNTINIFTILFFSIIAFFIKKELKSIDKSDLISLSFLCFLSFVILKILSPINIFFSQRNSPGL